MRFRGSNCPFSGWCSSAHAAHAHDGIGSSCSKLARSILELEYSTLGLGPEYSTLGLGLEYSTLELGLEYSTLELGLEYSTLELTHSS